MTYALPTAPESIRQHYAEILPASADLFDRIFAWIDTFDDGCMTEGLHVAPLCELAKRADRNAILACVVLYNHNQDEWLWNRMGFHALAGIQSRLPSEIIQFAREIAP